MVDLKGQKVKNDKVVHASLTLDPLRNRIRIYRQTIRLLKNPAYIQFLVNPEELYIAVLGSDKPISGPDVGHNTTISGIL